MSRNRLVGVRDWCLCLTVLHSEGSFILLLVSVARGSVASGQQQMRTAHCTVCVSMTH